MTHIATTLAPMHPPAVHSSPSRHMFVRNELFNSDLSKWNVAKVTKMINMFNKAKEFNSDLSKWNVNKVMSMQYVGGAAALFFSPCSTVLVSWRTLCPISVVDRSPPPA